jgi:hypothetical protein
MKLRLQMSGRPKAAELMVWFLVALETEVVR